MDKDRIKGAPHQAKGAVKEAAGKVTGDAKLQTTGKAEKVAGKVQSAVGGAKDAVKKWPLRQVRPRSYSGSAGRGKGHQRGRGGGYSHLLGPAGIRINNPARRTRPTRLLYGDMYASRSTEGLMVMLGQIELTLASLR
jgi:uncharacterized protein YjbJ (UPF0337 family)